MFRRDSDYARKEGLWKKRLLNSSIETQDVRQSISISIQEVFLCSVSIIASWKMWWFIPMDKCIYYSWLLFVFHTVVHMYYCQTLALLFFYWTVARIWILFYLQSCMLWITYHHFAISSHGIRPSRLAPRNLNPRWIWTIWFKGFNRFFTNFSQFSAKPFLNTFHSSTHLQKSDAVIRPMKTACQSWLSSWSAVRRSSCKTLMKTTPFYLLYLLHSS